jgi:hypothetical protein
MSTVPASVLPHSATPARWLTGLAFLLAAVLASLALRPVAHVYDMPMTEDGYYALAVARNLAAGHGLTIDGVNLTNGFQPLFTLLQGAVFWLAGGEEIIAMRLVMGLGWLFHIGGALLVAALARDAWPAHAASQDGGETEKQLRAALAAVLYLASPLMLNHAYNGLETGCVMFFYAAIARWMQLSRDETWPGLAFMGALVGLLVLARIDAAFVALVLGLNELRRAWPRGLTITLARGALLGGTALVVSLPWWLYNTIYFGSPMPTSGTAQQAWGLEWLRLEHAEWALRLVLFPWLFAGAHEGSIGVNVPVPAETGYMTMTLMGFLRTAAIAGVLCVIWRAWKRDTFTRDLAAASVEEQQRVTRTREFAACFLIAFAGLVVYYAFSFIAYWFYYRYFAPLALIAFVVAPILAARWLVERPSPRPAFIVIAALALQIVILAGFAWVGRGLGGNTVYHDQVALVRQHVPAGAEVAAGQSGTLGFFRERVVNTDGKVNREALAYQDRMWEYLRQRDVRWFVDWPFYINKYLGVPLDPATGLALAEGNGWRRVAEQNYFYLYEYVGPPAR